MIKNNVKNHIIPNSIDFCQKNILKNNRLFGLWIFLMSDCIMFAVLFSMYAVISENVYNALENEHFLNLFSVFLETFVLLLSSLSCGLIVVSMQKEKIKMLVFYFLMTFFLGLVFLLVEINEFCELIEKSYSPSQHALFSIFFALVGMHGMHIFFGLVLILSILYQIKKLGLTDTIQIRILCFSLFWHFLDIIWICIFTFVYLNRAI